MATIRSADYSLMREMNIALILERLHHDGPLSRAQLAHITGLNKTTVSSLVKELVAARFVRENGIETGDKGRPAIRVELNPDAGCIIGAEIGVDFISAVLTDFSAAILWRHSESSAGLTDRDAILDRTVSIFRDACARAGRSCTSILGLGLGVPGLVDVTTGTLLFAPNLGWSEVPLRSMLEGLFDFPIYVDNEASMATLGESWFGVARGSEFVLYVSSGVGLGGGIVVNDRILPGITGFAGEVGHMTIDPDGPPCNCGNFGCWETYVSQRAVFRRVREAVTAGRDSSLVDMTRGNLDKLTIPLVVDAARGGDAVARSALEETGRYLGIGLANLINALNPQRVVLGGTLSRAAEFLLPVIRETLQARALRWSLRAAELVIATYGDDACVMGGIATVYHHVLSQPRVMTRASVGAQQRDGRSDRVVGQADGARQSASVP